MRHWYSLPSQNATGHNANKRTLLLNVSVETNLQSWKAEAAWLFSPVLHLASFLWYTSCVPIRPSPQKVIARIHFHAERSHSQSSFPSTLSSPRVRQNSSFFYKKCCFSIFLLQKTPTGVLNMQKDKRVNPDGCLVQVTKKCDEGSFQHF